MKTLGVIGTAAMFLVGGGIIAHGIHPIEVFIKETAEAAGALSVIVPTLLNGIVGIITGAILMPLVAGATKLKAKVAGQASAAE